MMVVIDQEGMAITTLPLLHKSLDFPKTDLTLYIDDRSIFALGPTFISTSPKAINTFTLILDLLHHMKLKVDSNKTKLMFFTPPHLSQHHRSRPPTITIPLREGKTLTITSSQSLCYLGMYFMLKLNWLLYVKTMANRA
jgi:hypothetical protein